MKKKVSIIYEDDAIIVVNKPPAYLTIPDRYSPQKANLTQYLNQQYGKVYVVHRLDKETSGIICFARNEKVHKHLNEQFESRKVEKFYWALVEGQLHKTEDVIDKPIAPSKNGIKMVISNKGKPSVTKYKVIERFDKYTQLEAQIMTGRTHQIRVHFASLGYPLAVDALYGRTSAFYLSVLKRKKYRLAKDTEERPLVSRTTLHAERLLIDHPTTGERLSFTAPIPKDLNALLNQLRKWGKST